MIKPSGRTAQFHYAIRGIVAAAEALEREGRKVTYLNIGDPQAYGFRPPAHVVEPVVRALRDGFTGYAHSSGLPEASEAADLLLSALVDEGDEVLLPAPGYPIYTAILNKLGAHARYYHLDAARGWRVSPEEIAAAAGERTRPVVLINPNNPTGSIVPDETTREILSVAARHGLLVIADEVYRELCFGPPPSPASVLAQGTGVPVVTLESLSKTHLVPGWRV